jgi:hypothetical protein
LDPASPKSPASTSGSAKNQMSSNKNTDTAPAFQEFKRNHASPSPQSSASPSGSTSASVHSEEGKRAVHHTLPPPPVITIPIKDPETAETEEEEEFASPSMDSEEEAPEETPEVDTHLPPPLEVSPKPKPKAESVSMISSLQDLEDLSDDQILSPLKEIPSQPKPSFLKKKSSSSVNTAAVPVPPAPAPAAPVASLPVSVPTQSSAVASTDPLAIQRRVEMSKSHSLMSFGSRQNSSAEPEELERENITASDIFSRMGSLKEKIRQSSSRNFGRGESTAGAGDATARGRSESNVSTASGVGSVVSTGASVASSSYRSVVGSNDAIGLKRGRENEDSSVGEGGSGSYEAQSVGSGSSTLSAMERLKLKLQKSKLEKEGK